MASIFQRKKGGAWWIKYYANGRQVYYSLGTKDARVAKRVKRQIEGEDAKGELLAPSKTPLPAFLEDFCRFLSTIRTKKSYSADLSVLEVPLHRYQAVAHPERMEEAVALVLERDGRRTRQRHETDLNGELQPATARLPETGDPCVRTETALPHRGT